MSQHQAAGLLSDNHVLRSNLDTVVARLVAQRLAAGHDLARIRAEVPAVAAKCSTNAAPGRPMLEESITEYVREAIERELAGRE